MEFKKYMWIVIALISIWLLALFLGHFFVSSTPTDSFQSQKEVSDFNKKIIVVTNPYVGDLLSRVISSDFIVVNLIPANVDVHDYEPKPNDYKLLDSAVMVVYSSESEPVVSNMLSVVSMNRKKVLDVAKMLKDLETEEHDEKQDHHHSHYWLNPLHVAAVLERAVIELQDIDEGKSEISTTRLKEVISRLNELDKEIEMGLQNCRHRNVIIAHRSLDAFCDRYSCNQYPLASEHGEATLGTNELIQIIKIGREQGIKYVFTETFIRNKLIDQVAQELNADTLILYTLESADDAALQRGEDYFFYMRKNLDNMRKALECT